MSNQVFNEGPTTSQHIDSKNDDHFEKTTFKLKRTQSMGLLDNFITNSASTDNDKNMDSDLYSNTIRNSHNKSVDTDSIPVKCSANKITSRSFVSNDTLNKLNLNNSSHNSNSNAYLHSHSNSHSNSNSNSYPHANSNSYPHANPNHPNNKNKHCINSPSSFQSDDFFDDLYNSEDSLSSTGSVNLTPKHQLKKFQLLNQYNDLENNNNGNDLINNNNNNNQDINHLLHDDIDIKDSPKQHVDYLSHKWDEEEISKSWKYVILKKNDVAESARLENASWRTWAQTRNRLKTISPEELNWSKDNDVTWLYGPVFNNTNNSNNNKNKNLNTFSIMKRSSFDNSNNSFLNNSNSDHLKSILKKKSNVEKMISDASYCRLQHLLENHEQKLKSSPILESTTSDNLNSNLNLNSSSLTTISSLKSDTTLNNSNSNNFLNLSSSINNTTDNETNNISSTNNDNKIANNKLKINTGLKKSLLKNSQLHIQQNKDLNKIEKKSKHIHFNMRVDQCISVDYPKNIDNEGMNDNCPIIKPQYLDENELDADDENEIEEIEEVDDYDDDYDDDDDNDGFVLNPTVSCPNISHRPPILSHNNSINSINDDINTIAPLPATTLKTCSDDEDDRMYTVSHNTKTNRGYDYYYDYNTVYSNSSNPMMYSVVNNNNEDVEMFDVPENCKIEDDEMDIDNSEIDLDLNLGPTNNVNNNDNFEIIDIPNNFRNDLPQFDNNIKDIDNEFEVQHIEYEHNNIESNIDQNLKRTPSIGTSSSSDINSNLKSISSQSLSTIKVGLSGLDLSNSGLKRSTGSGSKPQLYQLNHQNLNNNSTNSILSSRNNSLTSKKTFMFNNSDSDSNSGSDSDLNSTEDEQGNGEEYNINSQLNFNILNSTSATSLSDINKTISSSNGNLSNLNLGFNNNNNVVNSFKFNNINMGNDNINSDTDSESSSDQDIMIIPNRNHLISSSNSINSNLKR